MGQRGQAALEKGSFWKEEAKPPSEWVRVKQQLYLKKEL